MINLKQVFKTEIFKVFSLNAISTLIQVLTGLISVKIVASVIGASGVAIVGQLNNIVSILLGIAAGGINSGVTKYISEYKNNDSILRILLTNALRIALPFTIFISLGLIIFHNRLSTLIMLTPDYGYVFVVFGFTVFLYTFHSLLISVLNGFKEFEKYAKINIIGTIVGLVFTVSLVLLYGLPGALISNVTYQSVVFFIAIFICRKSSWMKIYNFLGGLDKGVIRKYSQYSFMTFVTVSTTPVAQLILRGHIIDEVSITEAGWWEAMNRISNMYLSVIIASFSVYYLPRLSELKEKWLLKQELLKCYKFIVPVLLFVTFVVYFLRHFIVNLLFTPDFLPMETLFSWQLYGDFFKICSFLLSYIMLAKAKTKAYVISELIFTLVRIGLSYLFVDYFGTVGLNIAYMISYIMYFLCMMYLFRDILLCKKSNL